MLYDLRTFPNPSRTGRWLLIVGTACSLSLVASPLAGQVGPVSNMEDLLEDVFKKGVYSVPVVRARTEDTEIGIEYSESGSETSSVVTTRTAMLSRSAARRDTRTSTIVSAVKRKVSGSLAAKFPDFRKSFQIMADAATELENKSDQTHALTTEESLEDKKGLDQLAKIAEDKRISFGPNAGFFRSTVVLSNISNAAGYVENLTVTLRWVDPKTGQSGAIDTQELCNVMGQPRLPPAVVQAGPTSPPEGATAAVSAAAAPAAANDLLKSCRIRVPAHDPQRPEVRIPVRFTGFNTGEIRTWMQRKVWLEIHPLLVSVGDRPTDSANIDAELASRSVILKVIQPDGRVTVRYVAWENEISAERALRVAFGSDRVETAGTPKRITRLGAFRSTVDDWGDPKQYRMKELEEGAWVIASTTSDYTLEEPLPAGTAFLVAFVKKEDLLRSLDRSQTFKLFWSVEEQDRNDLQAGALCGNSTFPGRRILPGDVVRIQFSVQRKSLATKETDFTALPHPSDPRQGWADPLAYRGFYEWANAREIVPHMGTEWISVKDWSLSSHGIGVKFLRDASVIDLQELVLATGASVEHSIDGTVTTEFLVDKRLLPSGMGEVCLVYKPAFITLTTGRTANPPTPPPGTVTVPGPQRPNPLPSWLEHFPMKERQYELRSRYKADLTVTQIGRAVDDPLAVAATANAASFVSPACLQMVQADRASLGIIDRIIACPLDTALIQCIAEAKQARNIPGQSPGMFGQAPHLPPDADFAAIKKEVAVQACEERAALRRIVETCSAGAVTPQPLERSCLAISAGKGLASVEAQAVTLPAPAQPLKGTE